MDVDSGCFSLKSRFYFKIASVFVFLPSSLSVEAWLTPGLHGEH